MHIIYLYQNNILSFNFYFLPIHRYYVVLNLNFKMSELALIYLTSKLHGIILKRKIKKNISNMSCTYKGLITKFDSIKLFI